MTRRPAPPTGGEAAPVESSPLGPSGGTLDLVTIAVEICRRYRAEFPDERERYGAAGNAWCVHDNQHLLNWAVEAANGDLDIKQEVSWLASVLEARAFPLDRLARNLDIGAEVVVLAMVGSPGRRLARVLSDTAQFVRAHGSFL